MTFSSTISQEAATRLTETLVEAASRAAAACEVWVGKEDKNAADFAAVEAMRNALTRSGERFRIAIGEGEIDEAPMLRRGEEIGLPGETLWEVAVDPLEGTSLCAQGLPGAVTAIAAGRPGTILSAPDVYMAKVMAGPVCPPDAVHVDAPIEELLRTYAKAAGKSLANVTVCALDRPRHEELVSRIRGAGAKVRLIPHGDLPAALWVCRPERFGVDLYMGTGGSPEGLLSAAIIKSLGGSMSARFEPEDKSQEDRLAEAGIHDTKATFDVERLIGGDAIFAMSSVTGTPGLEPARRHDKHVRIETLAVSTLPEAKRRLLYRSTEIDAR